MAVTELKEDTQDIIFHLIENLQYIEKLKNKDMRILLDKIVRKYGGKVVQNETFINPTNCFSCFLFCC